MRRHLLAAASTAALLLGTLGGVPVSPADAAGARHPGGAKAAAGTWTKISKSTVGIIDRASLFRTSDKVLHVVYPRETTGGGERLAYATVAANGALAAQGDVVGSDWSTMDTSPVIMGAAGGGLRVVFGGLNAGYAGKMYTVTSDAAGATWSATSPSVSVGQSESAYGSYGTSGTTQADGTPIAGWPLNSDITWHVGTGAGADSSFSVPGATLYNTAMVRDGDNVWISWFAYGNAASNTGVFARQILPSVGPILKAPGSSEGTDTLEQGRTALAASSTGGAFMAYCVGYVDCAKVRIWKVGTTKTVDVPKSKYADDIALSTGPGGRLWLAWRDNVPRVHALRTDTSGLTLGAHRIVGMPKGKTAVYAVAVEGSTGKGDVVINVGDAFWHTQVLPGLTLKASPTSWKHGASRKVTFTVSDAGAAVSGARVKVGTKTCQTAAGGKCTISFPGSTRAGKYTASATKSGYFKGTARLKVT